MNPRGPESLAGLTWQPVHHVVHLKMPARRPSGPLCRELSPGGAWFCTRRDNHGGRHHAGTPPVVISGPGGTFRIPGLVIAVWGWKDTQA